MEAVINYSVINHWQSSIDQTLLREFDDTASEDIKLSDFVGWLEKIGSSSSPDLCWRTGLNYDFNLRGPIGAAILGATTLGNALKRLTDFFPLIQDGSVLSLDIGPKWSSLSYKILDTNIWPRHHDALYSLGIYAALLKAAAPEAWFDVDIVFEAPAHMFGADLSKIVRANCRFEGDSNSLFFPTDILDRPLALAPSVESAALQKLYGKLSKKRKTTPFNIQVRTLIMKVLETGKVNQEDIAADLCVTSRTLRRKLTAEGFSFQKILDECRMQIVVLEFKSKSKISLSELAFKLGYSEHSTFSRAFARWAGQAPQDFRKRMLSAA